MFLALLGLLLVELLEVWWIWEYHLLDVIFYLGAFGALFGIGMKLHFAGTAKYFKQHLRIALIKFACIPIMCWLLLYAINLTPIQTDKLFNQVLLIESTVPTALMTVMMANLFHLDTRLASSAWFWNTAIFLLVPLPIILYYFS